ncbi:MAG: amidohydrolase family protein [Acetobacteraceae bacterium]|nr:amidohydrolase family protein [Acetobacteraceae bacterium]
MIDAHHHIWRQTDLPWLTGPMQPRIFGAYEAIRRDYPIREYLEDARPSGITGSVYVQANWPAPQFLEEAQRLQSVADATGWPHAIVAYADVTTRDARRQFDALAAVPLVRGIRMQLHWHENPQYRFATEPDLARDPDVQANVAALAGYGFSFDLQVFAPQMPGAAELAALCPEVRFVLQHAGMLEDTSELGLAAWRDGMALLAAQPNVFCKLSGLGTFIHRNDPDHIARIVAESLALFGPERCLWGSNFPIEKLWTTYADLFDAHWRATAALAPEQRGQVFEATARRVYRI